MKTKTKEQRMFEIRTRNQMMVLAQSFHDDFEKVATEIYEMKMNGVSQEIMDAKIKETAEKHKFVPSKKWGAC
jgi:hypothetical protein